MVRKKVRAMPATKRSDVESVVRNLAQFKTGRVFFTEHVLMRMLERDISKLQVFRTIVSGNVTHPPEWDEEHEGGWKIGFRFRTAGKRICVIVKLVDRPDGVISLVITAWN